MNARVPGLVLALVFQGLAWSAEVDPPGRAARLSSIQGNVSLQAENAQVPEPAELNRPLTSGDRVLTESESRAELSIGTAAVRLDERTDLSISNLDKDIAHLEVNSGAVSVHLRELDQGDTFEIDTQNATVRLMEPGDYRVDVDAEGTSTLLVRKGNAEIDSGSGPVNVRSQQQARLPAQDRNVNVTVLGAPDAFDDWSMDRERRLQDTQAERYVSREVVGYEDLDRYGTWYSDPEYGQVWAPSVVSAGWAPYTYGSWAWVGAWGWTWVDRAPWGYAPFHYGRWAHLRDRWCWVPGPRHHRPVWAPALVGWTDAQGYHSRHQRPRSWVPLGPREVYVPNRNVSPRYLRNVNIGNAQINDNTRITNAYRGRFRNFDYVNRSAPGVRPVNGGISGNSLAGNDTLQNRPEGRWQNGRGSIDRRDDNRNGHDRGSGTSNPHRTDSPRIGRSPPIGGHMTIPRSPTDRSMIQSESQRDRLRRGNSDAARGYDRSHSTVDRSANDHTRRQRQDDRTDNLRREPRTWSTGTPSSRIPDRNPSRSYGNGGSGQRSYGGAALGNGNQPRPAPTPRMEQRPVQPRTEQRPVQSQPQLSRPQPGINRDGGVFRGSGRS